MAAKIEHITRNPIHLIDWVNQASHPLSGAIVVFSGEVRINNRHSDQKVEHLFYECFESMANHLIAEIITEAKIKFQLNAALCVHRVGKVMVLESAVLVITSAGHRAEAYEGNRYILDRVKHEAPIWKKEYFEDGTYEWGHNCSCFDHENTIKQVKNASITR